MSVVTARSKLVAVFRSVTVAAGTGAPLSSTTTPSITPVVACDCARAGMDRANRPASTRPSRRTSTFDILTPSPTRRATKDTRGRDYKQRLVALQGGAGGQLTGPMDSCAETRTHPRRSFRSWPTCCSSCRNGRNRSRPCCPFEVVGEDEVAVALGEDPGRVPVLVIAALPD